MQCSVIISAVHFKDVLVSKFLVSLLLLPEVRSPHTENTRSTTGEPGADIKSSANGARRGNELSAFIQNSSTLLPEYDFTALA